MSTNKKITDTKNNNKQPRGRRLNSAAAFAPPPRTRRQQREQRGGEAARGRGRGRGGGAAGGLAGGGAHGPELEQLGGAVAPRTCLFVCYPFSWVEMCLNNVCGCCTNHEGSAPRSDMSMCLCMVRLHLNNALTHKQQQMIQQGFFRYLMPSPRHFVSLSEYIYSMVRYIYMYIYIYLCMYIYMYMSIYTYIHTYIQRLQSPTIHPSTHL